MGWIPHRGVHNFILLGALKSDVGLEQASEDVASIADLLESRFPETNKNRGVWVEPMQDALVGDIRPVLLIFMGAVSFVLLIACANVANLMLGRAAVREREVAIRMSLGASRARLMRQLLTESLLLSLVSGVFGLALAFWGFRALITLGPDNIPRLDQVTLDLRVLVFLFLVSVLTGLIFGLAPALAASKSRLQSLPQGGRCRDRSTASTPPPAVSRRFRSRRRGHARHRGGTLAPESPRGSEGRYRFRARESPLG